MRAAGAERGDEISEKGVRVKATTAGGAATLRPRASVARVTVTGPQTGGCMTATPAAGASLCAAVEWQRSSVTVMTSAVQCEGPGHWLEMSPVKLI